ncbi:hypothetical protein LOZ61_001497 [Ophidiomyces ophidiicola]|nr:hypothetical protein LOZ61_001497 [Ophidiomyces ophidiicola]KAI1920909.1 hypothetical protein LOZ60_006395 [Ophidiomyces ophidiicola]KAI1967299.1 hypothetical protein LOZ59_000959 [Ophidiomyces ophidiicola]KAI1975022.1 hypothetical protein LOZ56_000813 [Ophidiomyces ophidiicola]KAI2019825.1 hypothetical protein LOZ48_006627 [Ophidiomyces ophidiicola]
MHRARVLRACISPSRASHLLQRRLYITSHLPSPVSTVNEIRERCAPVFTQPGLQHIGWVGVFGSFSRGEQTPQSDVDFLVGYKEDTTADNLWHMQLLKQPLQHAAQREVDILYMHDKQSPSYIKAQAMLTAETIYNADGSWLHKNRSRAEEALVTSRQRLALALQQGENALQQLDTMSKRDIFQNTSSFEELIYRVLTLSQTLVPGEEDAKMLDSYFGSVYEWVPDALKLIAKYKANGLNALDCKDLLLLSELLTEELPLKIAVLKKVYLPTLKEVSDAAGIQYEAYTFDA